jgi:hypothetical protein
MRSLSSDKMLTSEESRRKGYLESCGLKDWVLH